MNDDESRRGKRPIVQNEQRAGRDREDLRGLARPATLLRTEAIKSATQGPGHTLTLWSLVRPAERTGFTEYSSSPGTSY